MPLRAALFDMDGTVFDSHLDWVELRRSMRLVPDGRPIMVQLEGASEAERVRGLAILHAAERKGAEQGDLVPGALELLAALHRRGVACALITNNSRVSADAVLARHPMPFDLVLTRDDGAMKPDPEALHLPLRRLGVSPDDALAIGDTHLDAIAAHEAGIREILLVRLPDRMRAYIPPALVYREAADLAEAREIVERLAADWPSPPR